MASSHRADEAAIEHSIRIRAHIDVTVAETILREAKQIMDELGVVFWLRQGTCLGAVRDHALMPWDDDVDIGSVYGLNGLTERSIEPVATAFRNHGYQVSVGDYLGETALAFLKHDIRIDWLCLRVRRGHIAHWPGARIPVRLFRELREIDFLGEKFLVPDPPEEYLRLKYGPDWVTPKPVGYEKDVVDNIPEGTVPGRPGRLRQLLVTRLFPSRAARLRVLDNEGAPVSGAEVVVAGWARSKTNREGYARLYLPEDFMYAGVIRHDGWEEVLYEEQLARGKTYVYRPDPSKPEGRIYVLSDG